MKKSGTLLFLTPRSTFSFFWGNRENQNTTHVSQSNTKGCRWLQIPTVRFKCSTRLSPRQEKTTVRSWWYPWKIRRGSHLPNHYKMSLNPWPSKKTERWDASNPRTGGSSTWSKNRDLATKHECYIQYHFFSSLYNLFFQIYLWVK